MAKKQPKESTEITKNPFANLDMDAIDEIECATSDNVEATEMIYSRFAMVQLLSPEMKKRVPGYEFGQIIDNQTRQIYSSKGPAPWLAGKVEEESIPKFHHVQCIPIFKLPTEFVRWKDRKTEGTGMHWKSTDPQDPRVIEGCWPPRGKWQAPDGSKSKAPPVTENINILCAPILNGELMSGYVTATFNRTSFSTGRKLVTHLQNMRSRGMKAWFNNTIYLYTTEETFGTEDDLAAVMHFAEGPPAAECATSEAVTSCYGIACYLAAVDIKGTPAEKKLAAETRQLAFINASLLGEEESHPESSSDEEEVNADEAFSTEEEF